ncbi:hypothetical protein X943_004073 [Babesia divergens]|uniref:BCNT-C domain-containing protein n=1 Tax=Babesia divergens TaxID=32595 RepID=A0AAD9GEM5_BABDI|nr:hypothetical protein X943_004073 [Babesia divergens]
MATILTMDLASDDEDSDYSMSESSSEDERELEKTRRKLKRELDLEHERQQIKKKVDSIFNDMLRESDLMHRHKQCVKDSDFMLQFHKKDYSHPERKNTRLDELERFTSLCSSRIFHNAQSLNIRDFKDQCRNTPDSDKLEIIRKAVSTSDNVECATSAKTYTFAGRTYTIKEQVDKSSKKYKDYLKKQRNNVGGAFSFIDEMASKLDSAPKISAIKKSEADWNQYKDDNKIDTLKKDHKFLKEQDFLFRAQWKEHDKYLNVRGQ